MTVNELITVLKHYKTMDTVIMRYLPYQTIFPLSNGIAIEI